MSSSVIGPCPDSSGEAKTPALVSIVIPCYNCARFVGEAIESALGQNWPRVEVLVIDDGSDDGSAEIAAQYPVRWFRSERGGVSAARNRGLSESTGEFIIFLDADDRLLPDAVSASVESLNQHPECCMAIGGHRMVTATGELIRQRSKPLDLQDHYARLLQSNFIECTSSVLYRRDILLAAGGFNTQLFVTEDYDLYLRLARQYPVVCHAATIAEYRIHQTNISRNSLLMLTTTLAVFRSQRRYAFTGLRRAGSYLFGFCFWRRKYGRQLTRDLATGRAGPIRSQQNTLSILARAYPIGILILLVSQALPPGMATAMFRQQSRSRIAALRRSLQATQTR